MVYKVTENPAPSPFGIPNPRSGAAHVTTIQDEGVVIVPNNDLTFQQSRNVRFPFYQIVQTAPPTGTTPAPQAPIIIQPTVINSSATLSSIYDDTTGMTGISRVSAV